MRVASEVPLALSMGDPAGCGPRITCKAWQVLHKTATQSFYVIAPPELFADHVPVALIMTPEEAPERFRDGLPVLPLNTKFPDIHAGSPDKAAAPAILNSIELGVAHCLTGHASGLVTNPINKALLYEAGFTHPGHTEFLAKLCKAQDTATPPHPVMMLVGGGLRVALATIHVPLIDAARTISMALLSRIARITAQALHTDFGIESPRLAFTGLNPHAGESGMIGREEIDIINPSAVQLRGDGINISDAKPADTVFHEALNGAYDAVIAMTHDQGLIPVKTLDFWGGVNVTLGLPIIRTSPDHGTAYDAAKSGDARADSLIAAIRLAGDMVANRAASHA